MTRFVRSFTRPHSVALVAAMLLVLASAFTAWEAARRPCCLDGDCTATVACLTMSSCSCTAAPASDATPWHVSVARACAPAVVVAHPVASDRIERPWRPPDHAAA
jgi:hypothetical protein